MQDKSLVQPETKVTSLYTKLLMQILFQENY